MFWLTSPTMRRPRPQRTRPQCNSEAVASEIGRLDVRIYWHLMRYTRALYIAKSMIPQGASISFDLCCCNLSYIHFPRSNPRHATRQATVHCILAENVFILDGIPEL